MSTISISLKDDYAILQFNRPKAHALNKQMLLDLQQALQGFTETDAIRGVIITGTETIFCAGLDVVELYDYNETEIEEFWQLFDTVIKAMVAFPKPLIAAVNGHAPAGGCVLALTCDYRLMAQGKGRIGLNEIGVGVVIPTPIIELARHVLGYTRNAEMIEHAALFLPEEAAAFGLVHGTLPAEDLLTAAETKLQAWLELPDRPWRLTKQNMRRPVLEAMDVPFAEAFEPTLKEWWSEESRERFAGMIKNLTKR